MDADLYKSLLNKGPFFYAYSEIIFNDQGKPVDFRLLEVNEAFERLTGINAAEIIGKKAMELFPRLKNSEFNWIEYCANIATNGGNETTEQYSKTLGKWFKVQVSSQVKNYFITIFIDVTHEYLIAKAAKELSQYTVETINYSRITELMREISGADYAVLNKFEKDGRQFTTKAISGINKNIQLGISMLGINLIGKKWEYDPIREEIIKDNKITYFESLTKLAFNRIPKAVLLLMESTFNLGEIVIVKTTKDDLLVGDFTLAFKKGSHLKNHSITESFADLTGLTLGRVDADTLLYESEEKYRTIFENMYDVFYEAAFDGTILDVSPSIEHLSKGLYKRAELIGESIYQFHTVPVEREKLISILIQNGKVNDFEISFKNKDGSFFWVSISSKLIFDDLGKPSRIIGSIHDITERKNTDVKIRESEAKFKNLVETASDSIFIIREDGLFEDVNQSACKTLGYEKEALIEMPIGYIDTNFPKDEFLDFWKLTPFHEQRIFETTHKKSDGTFIPVEVSGKKFKYNQKIFYYAIARDLTERKRSLAKLQKLEAMQSKMVSNIGDVIVIIDENGKNRYKSPNIEQLFGWKPEELIGASCWDLVHPDDLLKTQNFFGELLATPNVSKITEIRYRCKKGNYCHIQFTGMNLLHDPDIQGVLGNYHDITKRKEAELSLKETNEKLFQANIELVESKEKAEESEMRFKTLHNATLGGIAIHDKGIIWDCNQGLSEITGYSTDELNGMDGLLLIAESSRELVMNNILTDYEKPYEVDGLRKNGEKYPLRLEARKIPYHGKMMRSVEFRDITLQKKIENDLIIAKEKAEESDRLKTAFLANMSHEIRTPMNGILGFTNLLSEPGLTNEEKSGFISIIQKSGERMLNTVNDLIDISKIETGQVKVVYEEIDINLQVLYLFGFFEFLAKEKNLTITLENNIPDNFAIVKTDISKFDSILSNLIKNAIKYTEAGTIEIGCSRQNQNLEFYVRDTGIGIPKHRHQAIFNRFEQADIGDMRAFQGSGLGLAIAKAYTEMLGGKIWLESEPETGSTFYFNILSKNGEIEINERLEFNGIGSNKKTGGKIKLLIAEDDEAGYFYLVTILKPLNCEIIRCFTGSETVEKCRKNSDTDIILMDIRMPEMNGYDATQRIREFNKNVIVIAQTAFALLGDKEKALNAGCNEYISKPIKRKELIELIQKYVNK